MMALQLSSTLNTFPLGFFVVETNGYSNVTDHGKQQIKIPLQLIV